MRNKDGLLPCPFCGEYPKMPKDRKIKCENSLCYVQPKIKIIWKKGFEQAAKDDWNKRYYPF